ncbi:GNAT family N-acetyltransferase [Priestia filamentosa]|uniref:Alanine acetyltransferase n=1 Tax=Priestia filamentosa TaxID=1402861 RepID=A0A1X7G2I0_9BACI|nr:GNAT family protein [Priestia filamentosa]AKO92103.1 alanine acetyltransferase [Priestia filamentosa]MDT3762111.1 GNAT family protein [Priestia filamentosa]OXS65908.1 N-acetyltransferase [Priestia filamentosa]RJS64611.1 N-acetyltransferase [Priestia filamentosa]WRU96605.1 GNAT family protein [Priestia filamentosa]
MTRDVNNFPFIETNRLLLREIVKDDANDILKYLSDEEVMKYYGLAPFKTINEALNEISWYQSILNEQTGIRWGITLKGKDEVIGSCGFLNRVPEHYRTEIGYELSRDYWGHGIASEALEAVIRYGFKYLKLQRVEALVEPPNIPSQKLIEKNGFIREGLLRKYEFTCGKFDDLYMYSLLKQDFEKLQDSKLNM